MRRTSVAKIYFLVILFFYSLASFAQKTAIHWDEDASYKTAFDLFNKQKYGAAQKVFFDYHKGRTGSALLKSNAAYYAAVCSYELFNEDADDLLLDFIQDYPTNSNLNQARFYLGNFNYRKKKYKESIRHYEQVEVNRLDENQFSEYTFKLGYSYFNQDRLEDAKKRFFEIKETDTKYAAPAKYYYAHIAYSEKKYETALLEFQKLTGSPNFSPVVPYYITQIYYLQGKYENVISYAPALLDSANTKRAPEIARLIGESYYRTKKYSEAIPFLEKYKEKSNKYSNEDAYQLGYSYYKAGELDKAIKTLGSITGKNDSLAQNAYYHLGDVYLKKNQKQYARNAFFAAAQMDYDKEIKEDAHFTYAKLSYELSNNPYQEAITSFEKYIKNFPNSPRIDEAYKYLVNVYLTTKNYAEALRSIENIKVKSEDLKYAYQRIAFNRGVELYNNRNYNGAIIHFEKAKEYNKEREINALTYYWMGEAYYKLKQFNKAIENYQAFIFEPGAALHPVYKNTSYNIGYAYFEKKDYSNATSWFRKYIDLRPEGASKKVNDALLRIADSYLITKNYADAADYYAEAAKLKVLDTDYALFQRSVALGVLGKNDQKIATLQELLGAYSRSAYLDDAKFELGNAYMAKGDNNNALNYFKKVTEEHPTSSYGTKALLKVGLVHYNNDQDDQALETYKRVVKANPATPQSREALNQIRNIYVEKGKVDEFTSYISNIPGVNISNAALDSATYESAEVKFMKGDCAGAAKDFGSYLDKFTNGFFKINASFYKAECDFSAGRLDEALKGYSFVNSQERNVFTEKSLLKAASIHYKKSNWNESLNNYQKLEEVAELPANLFEAKYGKMRTAGKLNDLDKASKMAREVLTFEKVPTDIQQEAHLTLAKFALAAGNDSEALSAFSQVLKLGKNDYGAEAKYNIALLSHKKGNYKESETIIFEIVNQFPSYDYWIAKSFILLSDNYVALKDNFQAKATLQSIIDNYEGEDLKKEAQEKLNKIVQQEEEEKKRKETESNEINLDGSSGNQINEQNRGGGNNE